VKYLYGSGWTLVDPWAIALPKDERLDALATVIGLGIASAST
jgi:hypothetical protein